MRKMKFFKQTILGIGMVIIFGSCTKEGKYLLPYPTDENPLDKKHMTIFGFNTSDDEADTKIDWWGRVPCGRGYYGTQSLANAGEWHFKPGGKEYKLAGLHKLPPSKSSLRVNVSMDCDVYNVTSADSKRVKEIFNYARSVPSGWTVYITQHEYNRHIKNDDDAKFYIKAFQIIAAEIWRANKLNAYEGKGKVLFVINIAGSGVISGNFNKAWAPAANTMPKNTQFWADAYDNPKGKPSGYENYGTTYEDNIGRIIDPIYNMAQELGYLDNSDGGTRGWGIGEFCSPRRVAPKLPALDTRLGWGPESPYDIDGTLQAKAITDYANYCINKPVPPKVLLLWTTKAGANWNQSFQTAGDPKWDDGTFNTPGRHWQNWPIKVDPTKPITAWQHFIDISK
jgi:hypothetical protein